MFGEPDMYSGKLGVSDGMFGATDRFRGNKRASSATALAHPHIASEYLLRESGNLADKSEQ